MKKETKLKSNSQAVADAKPLKEKSTKISPKSDDLTLLPEETEEGTEEIPVEPPLESFQDLRYDASLASSKCPRLQVWDPVVSVLVKRPLAYQPPVKVAKTFSLGLKLAVDEKQQPLELCEPVSRFTKNLVEVLKRDKVQQPWYQDAVLRGELAKQEHALQTWKDSLESSAMNSARISKEIGRPAAELLLSTPLHLPPPENHRSTSYGPEQDFPNVEHQERFYHSDAFFWMPQRVAPAERSIDTSPTWTERKYYKPPLTISRPRLDDTLPASLRDGKRYQDQERARLPLQTIVVKSTAVRLHCPSSIVICSHEDDSSNREDSEKAPPDCVHSKACLMVEDNMYSWGEPGPQDLVEVGFVCLAGERAYNQIRLANMGKTVIRCFWFKTVHSDHFNKGHYRVEHFIFDCSDRILLPCDQVTLNVQFHADYPGFWREVWHLKTEPVLGPGGSSAIPISLWARTMVSDDNDSRRRELERQLDVLVAERVAANHRYQLLRNLSHRDYYTVLRERFPMTENIFMVDDVEMFEQANPGLFYQGHAMFTILKLYRKVRELRRPTIEVEMVENIRDFLQKYQKIPEKTEESSEKGKTQKVIHSKRKISSAHKATGGWNKEDVEARRPKLSKNIERKKDMILAQMPVRTDDVPRRTEVDTLLDGNPVDEDPLERRNISVKSIYKMVGGLDEKLNEKNNMLMELNQAVSDMSFRRGRPNVQNFKHLVCRTALCQAADDVVDIAQRLQHNMRLNLRPESDSGVVIITGNNSSEVKTLTAVQPTSKGEKLDFPNLKEDTRNRPSSSPRTLSIVTVEHLSQMSGSRPSVFSLDQSTQFLTDTTEDSTHMTSDDKIEQAKSVVTGSHDMYSKLLYVLVYERVERLLLDLLPLMTSDEQQLDPFKPRPEL